MTAPSHDVTAGHRNAPAVLSLVSVELDGTLKAGRWLVHVQAKQGAAGGGREGDGGVSIVWSAVATISRR